MVSSCLSVFVKSIYGLNQMFASRSRFRHVYGSPWSRDQCYDGLRVATSSTSHDATLVAVNSAFLAVSVESTGGGVFVVLPIDKVGESSGSFNTRLLEF